MTRMILWLLFATTFYATDVHAQERFHPSRVRLLVHGALALDDTEIVYLFVPAGNLVGQVAPFAYLGLKQKPTRWLGVEGNGGWSFGDDEPIAALSLSPSFGSFWAWTLTEVQLPSTRGYWMVELEYRLRPWLHAGIEGEGIKGSFSGAERWSNGGGPNLLFRLGKVGVDLAIHARDKESDVRPEFFLRTHLFL